jgi:chemotaxis protein MotB
MGPLRLGIGILALAAALATNGCVSKKKFLGMTGERDEALKKLSDCNDKNRKLNAELDDARALIAKLKRDTTDRGIKYRDLAARYKDLDANFKLFKEQAGSGEKRLMARLEQMQKDLIEREARLAEAERLLNARDSVLADLRRRLTDALLNFRASGLTVYEKNGKVYVSMSDKLLFDLGKTNVKPEGRAALKELSKVLESQPDIEIAVEGHTDSLPLKSANIPRDNWELSVLRATEVVKIISQDYGLNPKRITAAGHGEYFPVASNATKEGQALNRRTDIILTPKLDELYRILENR